MDYPFGSSSSPMNIPILDYYKNKFKTIIWVLLPLSWGKGFEDSRGQGVKHGVARSE
jgi:hypothetical protein